MWQISRAQGEAGMQSSRAGGPMGHCLLTNAEMARADALAAARGRDVDAMMAAAGLAVATVVAARLPRGRVLVLCGPGNNGGDGYVAARELAARGREVRVAALGGAPPRDGPAARAASCWRGTVEPALPGCLAGAEVVVDALFGAGLSRDLGGGARELVEAMAASGLPVVAVDVPSGVDGDTGAVRGAAARAVASVTFFRRKLGHLLLPGRALCGDVVLAPIGLPGEVLDAIAPRCFEDVPALWDAALPRPAADGHKFSRGHVLVVGGEALGGAARLAATAALRAGAGLATIAVPAAALATYRAAVDAATMVEALDGDGRLGHALADARRNACVLGPGNGIGADTRARTLEALATRRACVLDADALTSFAGAASSLFAAIAGPVVLTPHEGEFARLFGSTGDKLSRARAAAAASGAVVLLKGADTVVAHPDGRAAINANAPPDLATAGSGDVLAGTIAGFMAQGMPPFEAAAAGAWLHGAAGAARGAGLVASDLPRAYPRLLARLRRGEEPGMRAGTHGDARRRRR
jgi:NAD(P)H-hydrate epimerase